MENFAEVVVGENHVVIRERSRDRHGLRAAEMATSGDSATRGGIVSHTPEPVNLCPRRPPRQAAIATLSDSSSEVMIPAVVVASAVRPANVAGSAVTRPPVTQGGSRVELRVGLGQDVHRLVAGKRLLLGGVPIQYDRGLSGHSDADVLLHALTDALLGAAGLGDIGERFDNADPRWSGADSALFVRDAARAVRERRWTIANVDCTIFAERPKLAPHKPAIRRRLAELLEIDEAAVNVKAKTGEEVGPVGRGEAIAAEAIVLLVRSETNTND